LPAAPLTVTLPVPTVDSACNAACTAAAGALAASAAVVWPLKVSVKVPAGLPDRFTCCTASAW
jgi:hypothetical protein